jgi:hypothetical protein
MKLSAVIVQSTDANIINTFMSIEVGSYPVTNVSGTCGEAHL